MAGPTRTSRVVKEDDPVNHPSYYADQADPAYEPIKVIDAWRLGFCLGNCIKYIARAGRKDPSKTIEDLKKARWYLDHHIEQMEKLNDGR